MITRRLPMDLARHVAHATDCAQFVCARCGRSLAREDHAPPDGHNYEPQACDCPREYILEVLEERRRHDAGYPPAGEAF